MRYLITILFICLSLNSFSQIGFKGKPIYLDIDTIKGADTIYVALPELTGYYALSWEVAFIELGGTSDGAGILQSANDTVWHTVNSVEGAVTATPNDTITISSGASYQYWLYGTPSNNFRLELIGTVGDTTRVISNYIRK
jgi:hypothetical protein